MKPIPISDSVRLLKMANLSCIHIPGEVFQSSEGYLEPSRASGKSVYEKIADGFFLQKSFIVDVRRVLNTSLGLFFNTVYVLLEF